MKATLKASLEIWDIAVFADLAIWIPRPDLQLLCKSAMDRGTLDEGAIDAVLPGLSERARMNIQRHVRYQLLLVDGNHELTSIGRRCASAGEAPTWEQGVYTLTVASHPLFGCHILDFARTPGGFDRNYDDLEPLPSWLAADRSRIFTAASDGARRFSVGAFPAATGANPVCRSNEMEPGNLRWEIDLESGTNNWTIEGRLGRGKRAKSFRSAPESVSPSELLGIFGGWEPQWDSRLGWIVMAYDGQMDAGGRESFRRTKRYSNLKVGRFGNYDDVTVTDVPVGPDTRDDARIWAHAIVLAQVEASGAYIPPGDWQAIWSNATVDTPLAGLAGDIPDPTAIEHVNGKPIPARTRWLMAAGVHLEIDA